VEDRLQRRRRGDVQLAAYTQDHGVVPALDRDVEHGS
jgi:hypothetical protein